MPHLQLPVSLEAFSSCFQLSHCLKPFFHIYCFLFCFLKDLCLFGSGFFLGFLDYFCSFFLGSLDICLCLGTGFLENPFFYFSTLPWDTPFLLISYATLPIINIDTMNPKIANISNHKCHYDSSSKSFRPFSYHVIPAAATLPWKFLKSSRQNQQEDNRQKE